MSDQVNSYLSEIGDFASEQLGDAERHSKPLQTIGSLTASAMGINQAIKTTKESIAKIKNILKPKDAPKTGEEAPTTESAPSADVADVGDTVADVGDTVGDTVADVGNTVGASASEAVNTVGSNLSNIAETSFGMEPITFEPEWANPFSMSDVPDDIPASESLMSRLIAQGQARALSQAPEASGSQELDQLAPMREMMRTRGINFEPEEAVEQEAPELENVGANVSNAVESGVGQIRSMVTGTVDDAVNSVTNTVGNAVDDIGNAVSDVGNTVSDVGSTIGNTVGNAVKSISGAVTGSTDAGFFGAEGILDSLPGIGELAAPILAIASIGVGLSELFDPAPIPAGPELQADE